MAKGSFRRLRPESNLFLIIFSWLIKISMMKCFTATKQIYFPLVRQLTWIVNHSPMFQEHTGTNTYITWTVVKYTLTYECRVENVFAIEFLCWIDFFNSILFCKMNSNNPIIKQDTFTGTELWLLIWHFLYHVESNIWTFK